MPSSRRSKAPVRPPPRRPAKPAARPAKPAPRPPAKKATKAPPAPAKKPVTKPSAKPAAKPASGGAKVPAPELKVPLPGGREHVLSLAFVRDGDEFLARLETDGGQITELKNRSLDQLLTLVASELEDLLE
jgi:hypothetical protein